jgi:D-serine deaminase-like pyridoxal phosphate-dependent protein
MTDWFSLSNAEEVASPALILYPDRIRENIRRMIQIAGNAERLRLHLKTHKLAEVVRLHLEHWIRKFKCATIAAAEMAALAGADDVLVAYPVVGPNAGRLLELVKKFPATKFSAVADDRGAIQNLSKTFAEAGQSVEVLLDIDCGQHRTGVEAGPKAAELYRLLGTLPGLKAGGLHVYDGHVNDPDPARRAVLCEAAFAPVRPFQSELTTAGLSIPCMVAGGTPTFSIHAKSPKVDCSTGTCVLWAFG